MEFLGLLGSGIYFFSYYLLNAEKIKGNGFVYIGMNLVASILVIISLCEQWNLPSFITNSGWALISLYGMSKVYIRNKRNGVIDDK